MSISNNAGDFLKKLLNKNIEQRLGFKNGFDEIKQHPFFKEINFDDIINQKIENIFKPDIEDVTKRRVTCEQFTREDLIQSNLIINVEE